MLRSVVIFCFTTICIVAMGQPAARLSVNRDHISDLRTTEPRHHYLIKPQAVKHVPPRLKAVKDSIASLQAMSAPRKREKASLDAPHLAGSFVASAMGGSPNDNHLAVSKNGIVLGIQNQSVYAFRENGERLFLKSLRAFAELAPIGLKLFDPKVIYDSWEDRFIVLFLSGNTAETSRLILAFSQTPDPSAAWNVYSINGNPLNDETWSDFPTLSISAHEVFITTNSYYNGSVNNSGKKQSLIWRVSKTDGLNGTPLDTDVFENLKFNNTYLFNLTPSTNHFGNGQSILFLSNDALAGGDRFYVAQLANDGVSIRMITAPVPYQIPPDARQRGEDRKLNTNDCRILDAITFDDDVHFVLNTASDEFRPTVYYGIIRSAGTSKEAIESMIVNDEMDIAFPSIAKVSTDAGDVVMMLYLHTSSNHFPGSSAMYLSPTNDGLAVSAPLRIREGEHPLAYWGDYTKIVAAPHENGTAWISGSFGLNEDEVVTLESATIIGKITTAVVTPVEDKPSINSASLYPNPVKTSFTLDIKNEKPESILIQIISNTSRVVFEAYEKITSPGPGTYRFFMNADFLANGHYVVRIQRGSQIICTRKFTVAK